MSDTSIRHYLRMIRDLSVMPDDTLDNGMHVKDVAHQYVMMYRTSLHGQITGQLRVKGATRPPKRRKVVQEEQLPEELVANKKTSADGTMGELDP